MGGLVALIVLLTGGLFLFRRSRKSQPPEASYKTDVENVAEIKRKSQLEANPPPAEMDGRAATLQYKQGSNQVHEMP